MGSSSGVSVDAGCFEGQGLALGPRCPGKKLQALNALPQLGLSTLYLGQAALLGRQRQWSQSQGTFAPNSCSLTQPRYAPGLGQGSHQTFQPVALIGWRIALWIQLRGPVGIRGKGKESEAEEHPSSSWLRRVRYLGAKLGMEAGFVQAGGWGLDQAEEGAAELEPGPSGMKGQTNQPLEAGLG